MVELKRQITTAGHVLVREYIDDGYTGTLLDRPALNQLRADLKSDAFDMVYFLAADRIARAAAHQTIIVDELLKHGKKITIAGKDYEENPENIFALTVMGAANEFERAKIIERTTRGRLHRLRMGQLSSTGLNWAAIRENLNGGAWRCLSDRPLTTRVNSAFNAIPSKPE